MSLEPLDEAGRHALADALGDSPWTVITAHYLRRGFCKAYVEGDPMSLAAAVVQWDPQPDEPAAFGNDAEGIWRVLQQVEGWRVVNVAEAQAAALGAAMERDLGRRVRYYGDEHFILTKPPNDYAHPLVRRLTLEDVGLIKQAPPFLQQGRGFGGPEGLLREGIVAGAVDAGRLVGIVHTGAITQGYADIGVATLEQYRRQGISAAAASLVCREVQETGRTPVWSCGEDNWASLRVAEKVGFTPIGRRVYVIPTSEPARER